jgi:hypothetical protein
LRACFFRYCSMDTNGRRNVPISQGILWFLNLCSSYDAHEKNIRTHQKASWSGCHLLVKHWMEICLAHLLFPHFIWCINGKGCIKC